MTIIRETLYRNLMNYQIFCQKFTKSKPWKDTFLHIFFFFLMKMPAACGSYMGLMSLKTNYYAITWRHLLYLTSTCLNAFIKAFPRLVLYVQLITPKARALPSFLPSNIDSKATSAGIESLIRQNIIFDLNYISDLVLQLG